MNQQILDGNWNEIKGKVREKWGQLTDSDLPQLQGDVEQLVGIIQRKTGDGRESIEKFLQQMSGSAASAMGTAAETVRDYAQHASESVQHTAKQAADQMRAGYDEAERFVRNRPGESLLVCFGLGHPLPWSRSVSLRQIDRTAKCGWRGRAPESGKGGPECLGPQSSSTSRSQLPVRSRWRYLAHQTHLWVCAALRRGGSLPRTVRGCCARFNSGWRPNREAPGP